MAYELIFVPRMLGQSWAEAMEAASRANELTSPMLIAARLQPWVELVSAIRARLLALGPVATAYGADVSPDAPTQAMVTLDADARTRAGLVEHRGARHRELLHTPSGVRLSLFGAEALMSLPYWHADAHAERLIRLVTEIGQLVESITGLVGYLPRLRRGLDEVSQADLLADYRIARDAFNAATGAGPVR